MKRHLKYLPLALLFLACDNNLVPRADYDALRLFVGYHKDRESALVQVVDTTYSNGVVEYHLGMILEHLK